MLGVARSRSAFIVRNAITTETQINPLSSLPSQQFPQARTQPMFKVFASNDTAPVERQAPTKRLNRAKSMSSSGSKLFRKARSVERKETFLNKKPVKQDLDYRQSTKKQLKSHLQKDQYDRVNTIVERKLMISKVLTNNKNNEANEASKLSIRQQMGRSPSKSKDSFVLDQVEKESMSMLIQAQTSDGLRVNNSKYQSNLPEIKQSAHRQELHNSSVDPSRTSNSQTFSNDFLNQAIQSTIRREFQLASRTRQELEDKRVKEEADKIEAIVQKRLKEERGVIMQTMKRQFEAKLLESTNMIRSEFSNVSTIQAKNQSMMKSSYQKQEPTYLAESIPLNSFVAPQTTPAASKPPINKEDSVKRQPQQKKSQAKKQEPQITMNIPQAKPVERSIQNSRQTNKVKNQPRKPSQSSQLYKEVDDSRINDLDELEYVTFKKEGGGTPKNATKQSPPKANQSFNAGYKLDQSFQSQSRSEMPNQTHKARPQKGKGSVASQVLKPHKTPEQLERQALRQKILKINENDAYITAIGQVAGYCFKYIKKSRLPWQLPSLLLYRYCYDTYSSYNPLYQRAAQLSLIKQEEHEKFEEDNALLKQNLEKLKKAAMKKIELNDHQVNLIQGESIKLQSLGYASQKEVRTFIKMMRVSDQMQSKEHLMCSLRMINSVFIIRSLSDEKCSPLTDRIDEDMDVGEARKKFKEWSLQLQKLK